MRGKARSLHELSPSPVVAGDGIDMTALEIVAVIAGILLVGYLAVSELMTDFSQRSHMKRLIAEGYARLRAARYWRRYDRRVHRKRKLREPSRSAAGHAQKPASKQKSRLHRKMLRHRPENQRQEEGGGAGNRDHAC
jgi:hypothetical protein